MCIPAGLFQLHHKRLYFNPLVLLETDGEGVERQEGKQLPYGGWGSGEDLGCSGCSESYPRFPAVPLKIGNKTLQHSNFVIRKLHYFILVAGMQGIAPSIPCPAASQQTS